jgi:fatty-acyl-CoA synthase
MQAYPLTLEKFLEHAARVASAGRGRHGRDDGGRSHRLRAICSDAAGGFRPCSHGLGVRAGDCVATLAWNTQAHVEAWYAVMGMGAVCPHAQSRASPPRSSRRWAQSAARVLVASADLEPLAREDAAVGAVDRTVLLIDGRARSPRGRSSRSSR